jgi:hypothetical protein
MLQHFDWRKLNSSKYSVYIFCTVCVNILAPQQNRAVPFIQHGVEAQTGAGNSARLLFPQWPSQRQLKFRCRFNHAKCIHS